MKTDPSRTSWPEFQGTVRTTAVVAMVCTALFAAAPVMAETVISGQSDTVMRMGRTNYDGSRNLFPATEYLRLSLVNTDKDGNAISLHIGSWGRVDFGDKSFRDRNVDGDLQYGYLSYQGAKNNFVINAGRQFVTEGVAAQRLDGAYVRSDFAAGFAAAAYVGSPVVTEPNIKADNLVFGGRVTQSNEKYYTLGVSALKSYADSARYREEEGLDIWVRPIKQIDLTGRSSYNSITGGWMEHAYALSYTPLDSLKLNVDMSNINYHDFFYKVTTSALVFNPLTNGIDPNEKVLTFGGSAAYSINSEFTLVGDYKHYKYDVAKSANYFGGKLTYTKPDAYMAGASVHRMDGSIDRLQYSEFRLFASKKMGKLDLTLDVIDLYYDNSRNMYSQHNAITVLTASSYEINESLKIGANVEYSKNPFFNNEVKGLLKLTYLFETKFGAAGGDKK